VVNPKSTIQGNPDGPALLSKLWQTRAGKFFLRAIAMAGLILLFYAEEDLRGWLAWKKCHVNLGALSAKSRRSEPIEARARTEHFNSAYPEVLSYLGYELGSGTLGRMRSNSLSGFVGSRNPFVLAELTFFTAGDSIPDEQPDLALDYEGMVLDIVDGSTFKVSMTASNDPLIPLIIMEDVPLTDAIRHLARQAGLSYSLDCEVSDQFGHQPTVTIRWEDISAREALTHLLSNYALDLAQSHRTGIAHILPRSSRTTTVRIIPRAARAIKTAMGSVTSGQSNQPPSKHLKGSQGYDLFAEPPDPKPLQIWVRSARVPTTNEIADFVSPISAGHERFRAEPNATNSFRIIQQYPASYTAADYLAWSDQFTNDFDFIREGLKRPAARFETKYPEPNRIPNFVGLRVLAQTLGQRAQCELLLEQPAAAARDLALVKNLSRLFSEEPTNLVQAMIEVAVQGIYLDVIADGLRLRTWREPELAELQRQLGNFDLLPLIVNGMRAEEMTACRTLESRDFKTIVYNANFGYTFAEPSESDQRRQKIECCALSLVPSGWIHENMAEIATLGEKYQQGADSVLQRIYASRIDAASAAYSKAFQRKTPDNFLAALLSLQQNRAWQTVAWKQTCANETLVVCALERARIRNGEYPETLAALGPQFLSRIPKDLFGGQPLRYRRTAPDQFLLYSIGWNEKDDGGVGAPKKDTWVTDAENREGDWVWTGSANL
jgi:hypothetical protein